MVADNQRIGQGGERGTDESWTGIAVRQPRRRSTTLCPARDSPAAAAVLRLQRAVGNRIVAQAIQLQRSKTTGIAEWPHPGVSAADAKKAAEALEDAARAKAANAGTFTPSWAVDDVSQAGWRTTAVAGMNAQEVNLVGDVMGAPEVIVGRSSNVRGRGMLVLDEWLESHGIPWTQRWQDVYNKALYLRTSSGTPVNVMAGAGYSVAEAAAAEEGAAVGKIKNIPYWPDTVAGAGGGGAVGTGVKAGQAGAAANAGKTGAGTLGTVVRTEGTLVSGGGRVGAALGKVGSAAGWVADFLMPGPQDAILLLIQFASAYAENRAEVRQRGWHAGFPDGFAAGLIFAGDARAFARNELAPRTVSMDVVTEVAGTTGSWEAGYIRGLVDGIALREALSPEQRTALRHYAVPKLRAAGVHWNSETWYSKATVEALAEVIGPTLFQMVEEAEHARDVRNTQAMVIYDPRLEYTVPPLPKR
jgi:hypothetical protein